jgi:hypothetical protein
MGSSTPLAVSLTWAAISNRRGPSPGCTEHKMRWLYHALVYASGSSKMCQYLWSTFSDGKLHAWYA